VTPATAGYSGTPLVKKLGIKSGARFQLVNAPSGFDRTLGELPADATQSSRGTLDFGMLFVRRQVQLRRDFARLRDRLETNGMVWVAWPKKAAKIDTDVSESVVREFGLAAGLVDVKICAVDETWSGLKFVRRLRDR
jgi:hypothetical protein